MDPAEQSMLDVIVDNWSILASLAAGLAAVGWALWKIYIHQEAKFLKELEDDKSLQNHHLKFKRLSSRKYRSRYTARLRWSLGALSRFFGPHAFSAKSYELCLTWAFVYPVILGFLFFLISNQDISGFGLFPPIEEGRLWKVPLIFISIVGMIYSFYKFTKEDGFKSAIWLAGAFAVAFAGAVAVAGAFAVAFAGAFAVAFAGTFAGAGAGAFAVAFAGTVAVAFAGAGAVAGAVAGTVAFAVAGAGAGAGAGAVAGVILIAYNYFLKKGNHLLFYILYFPFLAVYICVFLAQPWIQVDELSFGILLFLVVLPIINSVLDFLSLGVTRKLLKKSLRAPWYKKLTYCITDLLIALVLLTGLIISLIFAIKAMTWAVSLSALDQSTFNLVDLWERIKSRSIWQTLFSPDGWVFIMIFSTFLPSFIHSVTLCGFLLALTQPKQSKIARFVSCTAPDSTLAVKEKNEIASHLAGQSILKFIFNTIAVIILLILIILVILIPVFFGDEISEFIELLINFE